MRRKGSGWKRVGEQKYEDEYALQALLYETAEVIPVASWGATGLQPKVFVREAGLPGSGSSDLVGIDEEGGITIIECKLAGNREVRRMVVGQVLEYAAYLWQMSYEAFDDVCCRAGKWQGKHLADMMRDHMDDSEAEWSEEQFRAVVEENLKSGSFTLIIAVDQLNEELRRIVEYVNSRGLGAPRVAVVQMKQFQEGDTQLLVPEVFGTPGVQVSSGSRSKLDEQRFLELCDAKESHAAVRLYNKAKALRDRRQLSGAQDFINFGVSGYSYRMIWPGNPNGETMFIGSSDNSLILWMYMVDAAPEQARAYVEKLREIPMFAPKIGTGNQPFMPSIADLSDADMDRFLAAVEGLAASLAQDGESV